MRVCVRYCLLFAVVGFATPSGRAAEPTAEQSDNFEKKIRPVLVEHCYKCHSATSEKLKGGLRVDGRALLITGGDSGTAIVPGDPAKSRLIEAIRYGNKDLEMPPKGKLPGAAIKDIEAWVKDGAPWPKDASTTVTPTIAEFDLIKRKKDHWAWQPVKRPEIPAIEDAKKAWVKEPVDAFILAGLMGKKLSPAAPADKHTWLRRVTFTLTGLPPTSADIAAFLADDTAAAQAKVVDRLLDSPQFGERWARHWLDLVRYAESRGHEFEPDIPNAYQYRDYAIRAFNADVPYDRFLHEHLAGDVLPNPRINPKDGANESIIGSGFWHLGEEVHSPVDIRQDQADRFDNRIDVMTKTFLGMTVACARCHDHKFDAITTKDYYALFGLLEGSSYRLARVDGWEQNRAAAKELAKLREKIAAALAGKPAAEPAVPAKPDEKYLAWLAKAKVIVDYAKLEPGHWLPDDVSFGDGPRPAGTASIRFTKDVPSVFVEPRTAAVYDRFWAGFTSGSPKDFGGIGRMTRQGNSIRTANILLEKKTLYYLVRGGGMAYAAVDHHTVVAGPLHGSLSITIPNTADYRWVAHNLSGYVGQRLQVELTADPKTDFAVALVVQSNEGPPSLPAAISPATRPAPENLADLAKEMQAEEKTIAAKVKWDSRLVLALWDGPGVDGKVFLRGNPRTEGTVVPHRSLEALAGADRIAHAVGSGRLEVAKQLTDPKNPLVSRVVVNRIWHHLFGRGFVASSDNFGVLGELPTNPELLDYLADEFVRDGWSMKRMIRRLVLTSTFAMSSNADAAADQADPNNLLWHKYPIRRLDGESIRDAILSISGRLDAKQGGPSVPIFLTPFLDGRGRPASGPIDGNGRRSIYMAVRRNFLSPFLLAFDTPIPFSTVGRRQVSNVPAQALIMLNDPFVQQQADVWAKAVLAKPGSTDDRIRGFYLSAYGRPATTDEIATCREFVTGKESDPRAWSDLTHTLFTVKEFVFLR